MSSATMQPTEQRRRRIRRNAWLLLGLAAAFYVAFIALSLYKGHA